MVDPFTVTIAAPYAKMYNTAPTIEVTVDREVVDAVILKQLTIKQSCKM